jgi:hypothetical protein
VLSIKAGDARHLALNRSALVRGIKTLYKSINSKKQIAVKMKINDQQVTYDAIPYLERELKISLDNEKERDSLADLATALTKNGNKEVRESISRFLAELPTRVKWLNYKIMDKLF